MRERSRKFLSGRGMRKLRRDRMAMAALAVIGVYLALALLVLLGVPSEDAVQERVAPDNTPGFFARGTAERRLDSAQFHLDSIQRSVRSSDPAKAIAEHRLGTLQLVQVSPEELESRLTEAWRAFDAASALEDDIESPAATARLDELDTAIDALYVQPTGFAAATRFAQLALGTDRQGRSILLRAVYSAKVAVQIGVVSALIAVLIGTLLGAAAGYFGGWVDHLVVWLYSTFSSIPWIVLLMVIATVCRGDAFAPLVERMPLLPVYAAFCLSFWISPCRVVRGEVMKLKELEYVQAAAAVGFGRMRILLRHVIPNTAHLAFINFSLLFIGAIKAEVILSFLGLGVQGTPSWGVMINHAKAEVLNGFFWQIGTATGFMLVLVLAFNVLSDALQDAFDPKHV
ncbi:MAG: ABC transporter permease [Planctomycetes bacterium]|nr:ABC transporter permease [Planctomycetota bacterium]